MYVAARLKPGTLRNACLARREAKSARARATGGHRTGSAYRT